MNRNKSAPPAVKVAEPEYEEIKHPVRLSHMVVQKKIKTSRPQTSAKSKKKRGKGGRSKRPLSNISAKDVSLQDAADYLGAAWTFGKWALAAFNTEEKHLYAKQVDAVMSQSNVIFVSGIGQGDDYYQRTGNSVKISNMRLDYAMSVNSTAVNNLTRIIVLRDLMNQGSTLAFSDVLQDTSSGTSIMCSPYNIFNGDRFEVLYDRVEHQSVGSDDAAVHRRVAFGINDHLLFKGTGSTVSSAWQGAIFVLAYSADTNTPFLTLTTLIDFVDD